MAREGRKRSPRRGKAQRARTRRLKKVLVLALVLVLIADLIPFAVGQVSPTRPSGSYGVEKEISALQEKRHSDKWADIIRSEAEGDLDAIDVSMSGRPDVSIEEQVILMGPYPPLDPPIYNIIETTTLPDRLTLIEFLVSRPASYYIYSESNGNVKWTQGFIRPDLIINWDTWVYIDVDDDLTTGDTNGNDIRVSLDATWDSWQPVFPRPLLGIKAGARLSNGGLMFQIEKISGPNATGYLPLELFVVKSFSYTGNNYLWMVGYNWSDMPNTFTSRLTATEIGVELPTFAPDPTNLSLFDNAEVMTITGPYQIDVNMDERPPDMTITISYSKVWLTNLVERVWSRIDMDPADGSINIPDKFRVDLDSPTFNKSFDRLLWTSTIPVNVHVVFKDTRENTTYADILIDDMPSYLLIELDDIKDGAGNVVATSVNYESNARIKLLDYSEYEFYGNSVENFTHSHLIMTDLPTKLYLNGTFEIGGEDEAVSDNLAIGLPARLMDSTMLKLVSKFYRVSKTLRTIPNNIIDMPEKKGWAELTIPGDDQIGGMEFYVSSRSRIEAEGDYLAFRNDSPELDPVALATYPMITSSLSGRLTGIKHFLLDFQDGTNFDLEVIDPRPFHVLFLDDGNDARATLSVEDMPPHFNLRFTPDNFMIRSSEPIDSLSYTSLVGPQFFQLQLEGIPTQLQIVQDGGRLQIICPGGSHIETFSLIVTDRQRLSLPSEAYNHIYLDRTATSYFTSLRLNAIRSLDMQMSKGGLVSADFAEERNLYIHLTDSILDIETRMLFKPFPSNFSIEMPKGFSLGGLTLPNVLNVSSIFAFSPMILQMSKMADDLVDMMAELTSNIAEQMGNIGSNTTIKLKSKVPTVLIADMRQGPANEVRWVHGINVDIDRPRNAIGAKIYMRLPLEATISMTLEGDLMDVDIDFKDFDPLWEFLDVRITGMEDKDFSLFLDGIPKEPTDIKMSASLDTNLTPGTGTVTGNISLRSDQDLGPMYISMRKGGGVKSIMTMYLSSVARRLDCDVDMTDHIGIDWDASASTRNFYVLLQKEIEGEWYDVTLTLNKVPTRMNIRAAPPDHNIDMDGSMLQGLPELSVSANTASLSAYIFMEGPAMGQPSTYEIHLRDITDETYTVFDEHNGVYKIRSKGLGFLYIRMIDMPFNKQFQFDEVELYADEVYSADLKANQALGAYPIIELTNFKADTLQIRTKEKVFLFGALRQGTVIYVDISTRNGIPWSTQMTRNGVQVSGGDHHIIIPAPIATMMATLYYGG